ncbi:MAG: VOC family protein [Chitinophagaceae bacterium]|jgi:catechol 2,3-dioxygenase-like lactoylglutathione lyase family enzyme|nr:VOC family protein [Chitinophagaceae bacterium]
MEITKTIFKGAWPYQKDVMSLPVASVDEAVSFYETVMGFSQTGKGEKPFRRILLKRDAVQIGLAENGGDPAQDGCFFEVDNVEMAFTEMKARGLQRDTADYDWQRYGDTLWKVFFVVAPDGLCYCIGERQPG